ncbi:MAG TPA: DUF3667 domain-containing protein [Gemmatimonadaceae bacterium]|jgi:hypothetical protein
MRKVQSVAVVSNYCQSNAMGDELRLRAREPQVAGHSAVCLNCGAALSGPFCASCGQRDIPPYPSVRELAVDAVSEFSGWDGRLATTLRALIRQPGILTHEFLEGRRARYISPLRLYLTASLVYFLVAAAAPNSTLRAGNMTFGGVSFGVRTPRPSARPSAPDRVAKATSEALESQQALTAAEREEALKDIARAPKLIQPLLRRGVEDPGGFRRGLLQTMPKMLFVLLPVFAGIVALFYRGRKYPEHLYFAIHLHAFIFLALAMTELLKFTQIPPIIVLGSLIALVWIPVYTTFAFRRVYGGSMGITIAKELGIGAIYAIISGMAFLITIYWVSIAT